MNFEFKKIGEVVNGARIRYSTAGKGASTMNFEFNKVWRRLPDQADVFALPWSLHPSGIYYS
jgi:hypothetical protein